MLVVPQECDFSGVGIGILELLSSWTKGCFIKLSAFEYSVI